MLGAGVALGADVSLGAIVVLGNGVSLGTIVELASFIALGNAAAATRVESAMRAVGMTGLCNGTDCATSLGSGSGAVSRMTTGRSRSSADFGIGRRRLT